MNLYPAKRYKMSCMPIEDSDQTVRMHSLLMGALWVAKGPMFLHAENLDSDQSVWMHSLI